MTVSVSSHTLGQQVCYQSPTAAYVTAFELRRRRGRKKTSSGTPRPCLHQLTLLLIQTTKNQKPMKKLPKYLVLLQISVWGLIHLIWCLLFILKKCTNLNKYNSFSVNDRWSRMIPWYLELRPLHDSLPGDPADVPTQTVDGPAPGVSMA